MSNITGYCHAVNISNVMLRTSPLHSHLNRQVPNLNRMNFKINGIHNGNKKLCFQTNAEHGQARRRKQCLYRVNQCCQNLTTFHFCLGREEANCSPWTKNGIGNYILAAYHGN